MKVVEILDRELLRRLIGEGVSVEISGWLVIINYRFFYT